MPPFESSDFENPYVAPRTGSVDAHLAANAEFEAGELRPFRTIWTHPRLTVRRLVAHNPELYVVPLVCLAGIGETLDRASMRNAGDKSPLEVILGIAVVLGPLFGLLSLWIMSHLIRITGNWIGGTAPREHIRTAIAWASVPAVVALPLWIPQLALFGSEMFTKETPRLDAEPMLYIPLLAIIIIEMILGIWGFVLLCNTVAEVQGYRSACRGLGNLLLAGLLLVVPILVIAFVLVMLLSSGIR